MKLIDHATEGLRNLYFSKLRAVLALLGVLVGTASVVAMVLGGELATHEALKQFKSLGTDLLAASINSANDKTQNDGQAESLTLAQAINLINADRAILNVAPYTQIFHPVYYEGNAINSVILGVTEHFATVIKIKLKTGRFISLLDQYNFYCVIGRHIYDEIKQFSSKEPLGQPLQIGKNYFTIVGIADSWPENSFVYANIDESILIPALTSMAVSQFAAINNIIFQLKPEANITKVENHITAKLNSLLPDKQISFRSAKELITRMQNQNNILTVFLGLIGSVSLIVGGIGVMNIMLVSVVERRREIGIRLAVGAKRKDIGLLFLMEAVMLSLVGGILGVSLGILIAYIIAVLWHWEFILYWWPPIVGFTVSVAVGIFSGFYPAFLASKLDPIEGLRSD